MNVFRVSDEGTNRNLVFLPGILADGEIQAEPIMRVFRMMGGVYVCDYGPAFDGAASANAVTGFVEESVDAGREVVLFGTSLGGQLALDACRYLPLGVRRSVHAIMVDTPAGIATMPAVPEWAASNGLAESLFGLPLGPLGRVRMPVTKGGLPKDENIVLPEGLVDQQAAEAYRDEVRKSARFGLEGHRLGTFWGQMRYMAQLNLSQQLTNTAGLGSLTYIACTGDNVTVRQPEAAQAWQLATWGCRVFEVPTAHAAFLEARPIWEQRLTEIFREIGLLA